MLSEETCEENTRSNRLPGGKTCTTETTKVMMHIHVIDNINYSTNSNYKFLVRSTVVYLDHLSDEICTCLPKFRTRTTNPKKYHGPYLLKVNELSSLGHS